jgi:hypothetical protein
MGCFQANATFNNVLSLSTTFRTKTGVDIHSPTNQVGDSRIHRYAAAQCSQNRQTLENGKIGMWSFKG